MNQTGLLKLAIDSSRVVEAVVSERSLTHPLPTAGFGFLVRNRRIAEAVRRLGAPGAYEARMLMRTMLEIQSNYAWMRLQQSYSRALRFHRFVPLEKLKLLRQMNTLLKQPEYNAIKKRLEKERSAVRHLFRFRDRNGRMQWDRSWAAVSSVEARLAEVIAKERPGRQVDPFMYGMYVSFSSATHGSPTSIIDVIARQGDRLSPKAEPESKGDGHYVGAAILLAWTIDAFVGDARLKVATRRALKPLRNAMGALQSRARKEAISRV